MNLSALVFISVVYLLNVRVGAQAPEPVGVGAESFGALSPPPGSSLAAAPAQPISAASLNRTPVPSPVMLGLPDVEDVGVPGMSPEPEETIFPSPPA